MKKKLKNGSSYYIKLVFYKVTWTAVRTLLREEKLAGETAQMKDAQVPHQSHRMMKIRQITLG